MAQLPDSQLSDDLLISAIKDLLADAELLKIVFSALLVDNVFGAEECQGGMGATITTITTLNLGTATIPLNLTCL